MPIMKFSNLIYIIRNDAILGWHLFFRDFQYRYRLTFLGYFWAIIRPLFVALPIIFVGKQFDFGGDFSPDFSYEAYAFTGFIFFKIFWDAIEFPQFVMWRARKIITEVKIPYISIIIAGCYYIMINIAVYIFSLVVVFVIYNVSLKTTAFLSIFSILLCVLSGLSIGIIFSPIALFYLDIRYGIGYMSSVFMWSVPIFYVTPVDGFLSEINKWNPLTYLIEIPRYWLIGGPENNELFFGLSITFFLILFLVSLWFYHRAMPIAIERTI